METSAGIHPQGHTCGIFETKINPLEVQCPFLIEIEQLKIEIMVFCSTLDKSEGLLPAELEFSKHSEISRLDFFNTSFDATLDGINYNNDHRSSSFLQEV